MALKTHPRSLRQAIDYMRTHRRVELTIPILGLEVKQHCFFAELRNSTLWFGVIRRSKWGKADPIYGDPIGVRIHAGDADSETGITFGPYGFALTRGHFVARIKYLG